MATIGRGPSGGPLAAARALRHSSSTPGGIGAGAAESLGASRLSLAVAGMQGAGLTSQSPYRSGAASPAAASGGGRLRTPGGGWESSGLAGVGRPGAGGKGASADVGAATPCSSRSHASHQEDRPKGSGAWQAMAWPDRFGEPMALPPS
mmetsp:Transcript_79847/g.171125  ORF Transcript_79847/g.171125 Transcript_79847/m.171125 type:complete len:149 (+) Transcript_79847:74-520(+)